MQALKSLDTLLAALETWRRGSPSRAAQHLGIAPSSVYRALDRLEAEAGTKLFVRTAHGWRPTKAGDDVRLLAETMEAAVRQTELALIASRQNFPDTIRITASDSVAHYLASKVATLKASTPDVALDLMVDNHFVDLLRRQADIAIRPDKTPGESLYGQRAGLLAHALYGAQALVRRNALPRTDVELSAHPFCALSPTLSHFTGTRFLHTLGQRHRLKIALITNSELHLARAIEAGAGLGVLPCFIGDRLPGVVRMPLVIKDDPDIWIVTHPSLKTNSTITRLIRQIAKTFRSDAASFSGRQG